MIRNKPGRLSPEFSGRFSRRIWLFFHGGLLAALGLSLLLLGPVRVNTNLLDILPASSGRPRSAAADKKLGDKTSRQLTVLIGHSDFLQAKKGAEVLCAELSGPSAEGLFENVSLYVDETVSGQLADYIFNYRYALLDGKTRALLEGGDAPLVAAEALSSVYGAFTFASLDNLEQDPFLLAERNMKQFLETALSTAGSMSLRDDVLASQYRPSPGAEELWYVLLRASLTPRGAAITNADSGVKKIYDASGVLAAENPGLSFVYSGGPFHSYESSSGAQREISLISTVTLLIIIFLFLYVFRSPLPIIVSVAAACLSILSAVTAVLLFFREVHVLSFVFGTTLIGTCVDYSIHYFIHWKGNPLFKSGLEIRRFIIKGILLSFISTEVCFAALFFAPFIILKQFAVFSFAGLLSSFLSVSFVYPFIALPPENRRVLSLPGGPARNSVSEGGACYQEAGAGNRAAVRPPCAGASSPAESRVRGLRLPPPGTAFRKAFLALIFIVSLVLLAANRNKLRVENDIRGLYTMTGNLMESERIAAGALNLGSAGWYFIVAGSSPEEVLQNEEALRARLDEGIKAGVLKSYLASSLFVPSRKTQELNYRAARNLLPLADSQFAALGFPPDSAEAFRRDFEAARDNYVLPPGVPVKIGEGASGGGNIPAYLMELVSNVWIGEADGACYSCVLPLHAPDEAAFRAIAEETENVFFVNKVRDIGDELDKLTRIMLFLFLGAYLFIALVVKRFYSWVKTLRICLVPFLLVLVTITMLACLDIPLGFFPVVGLILVFGLG
ncbi:MAG: MMPL family transporter, partial [Spirochaetaceae bacterium]|nr:MMPL family transporter [Spirochaetaceae bacterium]